MTKPASPSIPLAQFAADHAVTPRTVRNWVDLGMPCRLVDGERRVVRSQANPWVRQYEREQAKAAKQPAKLNASRARKLEAEARLVEMDLQEREGRLVPIDDTRRVVGKMLGRLRAQLIPFPQRWAPKLAAAATVPEAERLLSTGIHELMATLSGPELPASNEDEEVPA